MADNHVSRKKKRDDFDKKVADLLVKGFSVSLIAATLDTSENSVRYAIKRIEGVKITRIRSTAAEEEAIRLISIKLAPVVKPKAKLVEVNGWENGKYVHYTAWDVSEFWGL